MADPETKERPGWAMVPLAEAARLAGAAPKTWANKASLIRSGRLEPGELPPVRRLQGRPVVRLEDLRTWLEARARLEVEPAPPKEAEAAP